MVLENELREQLLGQDLPCTTREQMLKKQITDEMVKSILPFMDLPGHLPFHPIPNSLHLKNMIQLYESWKDLMDDNSDVDRQFSKKITQYLLKVAHYWWNDIRYVAQKIINYYIASNKDYREIIYGVTVKTATWKTLFKWEDWLLPVSTNHNMTDNSPLVYCLDHYDFEEMNMFEINPTEQSCLQKAMNVSAPQYCFREAKPDKLLLLLQYDIPIARGCNVEEIVRICILLLDEMISSASTHLVSISETTAVNNYCSFTSDEQLNKKFDCARILLRVIPQITASLELIMKCEDLIGRAHSLNLVECIPGIVNLKFPFKLRCICRFKMRSLLKQKHGLPHAIEKLSLSQNMKDYINLLHD